MVKTIKDVKARAEIFSAIIFLILLQLGIVSDAQSGDKIATLNKSISGSVSKKEMVSLLCAKSEIYSTINVDSGLEAANNALDIANELDNRLLIADCNYCLALNYTNKSYYRAAISAFNRAEAIYGGFPEKSRNISLCKLHEAIAQYENGNYFIAVKILETLEQQLVPKHDYDLLSRVYFHLGNVALARYSFPYNNTVDKAKSFFIKSVEAAKQSKSNLNLYRANLGMAEVFNYKDLTDSAKYYLQLAEKYHPTETNYMLEIRRQLVTANFWTRQNKYEQSYPAIDEMLRIAQHLGNIKYQAIAYDMRAAVHFLQIRKMTREQNGSEKPIKIDSSKCDNIFRDLKQAITLAQSIKNLDLLSEYYLDYSQISEQTGNKNEAFEYLREYFKNNNQFGADQREKEIVAFELNHAFTKKEDSLKFRNSLTTMQLEADEMRIEQQLQKSMLDSQNYLLVSKENKLKAMQLSETSHVLMQQQTAFKLNQSLLEQEKTAKRFAYTGLGFVIVVLFLIFQNWKKQKSLNQKIQELVSNQEKIIEERTADLYKSNQKLKDLIAFNAHQIREPLTRITGVLHLYDDIDQDEFHSEFMPQLEKAAFDLDDAIKDILEKTQKN